MNKLTIEEQYLTLSQSKELQALGIDFSGANYCFRNVDFNKNPSWKYIKDKGEDDIHIFIDLYKFRKDSDISCIKTLSVAEMMEMLPKVFIGNLNSLWFLEITCKATHKDYQVRYIVSDFPRIEFRRTLIRDALFEMLKWLKQNKMI